VCDCDDEYPIRFVANGLGSASVILGGAAVNLREPFVAERRHSVLWQGVPQGIDETDSCVHRELRGIGE
jgi:hypothetical protein